MTVHDVPQERIPLDALHHSPLQNASTMQMMHAIIERLSKLESAVAKQQHDVLPRLINAEQNMVSSNEELVPRLRQLERRAEALEGILSHKTIRVLKICSTLSETSPSLNFIL